jgi:hypothetical protein
MTAAEKAIVRNLNIANSLSVVLEKDEEIN